MFDPMSTKQLALAAFNAGIVYGSIKAGLAQAKERQIRQGRAVTRLLQYKAWSHRALSVLIAFHRQNHPGQEIIDDWNEIEEGTNGG